MPNIIAISFIYCLCFVFLAVRSLQEIKRGNRNFDKFAILSSLKPNQLLLAYVMFLFLFPFFVLA